MPGETITAPVARILVHIQTFGGAAPGDPPLFEALAIAAAKEAPLRSGAFRELLEVVRHGG